MLAEVVVPCCLVSMKIALGRRRPVAGRRRTHSIGQHVRNRREYHSTMTTPLHHINASRAIRQNATLLLGICVFTLACSSHSFDNTQVPVVSVNVSTTAPPQISFQPNGAQLVRVYRGASAGDGYTTSLVWSIAATSKNSLTSSITYGTVPSGGNVDVPLKPLVLGETYTVQVTREDPKGTGDGFTNTRHRYVGTKTFVAAFVTP